MSNDKSLLGLYIPKQSNNKIDAPYSTSKEAEKWIEALPIAHVGETARLVFKALADLNRTELPVAQRFKILELFQPPIHYLNEALSKHFLGQPFPLTVKNQKIAELTKELHWETAIGYKIIIESNLTSFKQPVDSKILFSSIHRAIKYLGLTLLKSYQIYSPAPEHVWIELHHLYLFAEHNDFHTTSIKAPLNNTTHITTINDAYKKILLLALANPYRLPQQEIAKVYHSLNQWVQYSKLLPLSNPNSPPGLFSVNLDSDSAPSYYVPNKYRLNSYTRILDTSDLTPVIRDHVTETHPDTQHRSSIKKKIDSFSEMHQDTLRRLILAWGVVPKRSFSRTGKNLDISVVLGLDAAHYYINKNADKQTPLIENEVKTDTDPQTEITTLSFDTVPVGYEPKASFKSNPTTHLSDTINNAPDVWEIVSDHAKTAAVNFKLPSILDLDNTTMANIAATEAISPEPYTCYPCLLTNESVGGCRLIWKSGTQTKTVVGTLIGIKKPDHQNTDPWGIGVVRWMKNLGGTTLELGIEMLAPDGQAIATQSVTRQNHANEYSRSLLLPELKTINQPQTLITLPLYKVGDKLNVSINSKFIKVRLTKIVENTNTFCQFQFAILKSLPKETQNNKLDRVKNFDSIWSSI